MHCLKQMIMKNSVTRQWNGKTITIGSYKGVDTFKWGGWVYKHKIVVDCDGKKATFTFYNSQIAYSKRQNYLNEEDMLGAFENILDDAIAYDENSTKFEFLNAFGYGDDDVSIAEGTKAFWGCLKTYGKLHEIGLSTQDFYDIANYLRDELNY